MARLTSYIEGRHQPTDAYIRSPRSVIERFEGVDLSYLPWLSEPDQLVIQLGLAGHGTHAIAAIMGQAQPSIVDRLKIMHLRLLILGRLEHPPIADMEAMIYRVTRPIMAASYVQGWLPGGRAKLYEAMHCWWYLKNQGLIGRHLGIDPSDVSYGVVRVRPLMARDRSREARAWLEWDRIIQVAYRMQTRPKLASGVIRPGCPIKIPTQE